jgi:hypothetical protein
MTIRSFVTESPDPSRFSRHDLGGASGQWPRGDTAIRTHRPDITIALLGVEAARRP